MIQRGDSRRMLTKADSQRVTVLGKLTPELWEVEDEQGRRWVARVAPVLVVVRPIADRATSVDDPREQAIAEAKGHRLDVEA